MGGDGMEAIDLSRGIEQRLVDTPRRGCLVAACGCMDSRIVSPRRARFHAYLAGARGETANRHVAPDPGWVLPI